MTRARAPLAAALVILIALLCAPATARACQPPAAWLEALMSAARPSQVPKLEELEPVFRRVGAPALIAVPAVGPSPLRVQIGFLHRPVPEPATMETIIVSPGMPEQRGGPGRYNRHMHFVLPREGRYDVTTNVRGAGHPDYVATLVVTVLSRAEFERRLRSDWELFLDRLRRRDLPRALDCMSFAEPERHATMLADISKQIDTVGRPRGFTVQKIDEDGVLFTTTWTSPGQRPHEGEARFVPDLDGVWRLKITNRG